MTTHFEVREYPFGEPVRFGTHSLFAKLQREEPVSRIQLPYGGEGVLVTRFEDVELSGTRIRAGDAVFINTQAANRDESVFAAADTLDLTREHNPHMAFGHGFHHCLGAQLARIELQVVLETMLERFPNLRLAVPEAEIPWKRGMLVRGPKALQVSW